MESPVRFTPVSKAIAWIIIGTVFLGAFNTCMRGSNYMAVEYIRRGDVLEATRALSTGETDKVRYFCDDPYDDDTFSGIPAALIAASYYRDFMTGDEDALSRMGSYAQEAHKKEPNFLSRYYLALYLYEMGDYDTAMEETDEAAKSLGGVNAWSRAINRAQWQHAIGELHRVSKEAKAGKGRSKPWNKRLDKKPEGPNFEVEFHV